MQHEPSAALAPTPNALEPTHSSQITLPWLAQKALHEWGLRERKDWQLENVLHLLHRTEVVLTVATGAGKSMLMHLTLRAAKEMRQRQVGIAVMPTVVLANDQAREATSFGLTALAINHVSLDRARKSKQNLWKEVEDGQYDLALFSPEMLQTEGFNRLIGRESFLRILGWVFLDEIHMVLEWGKTWRPAYLSVGNLRNRLPSKVTFCGYTATLAARDRAKIKSMLGFEPDHHRDVQLPTDRPNIKYIPRFLTHSIGPKTTSFPDLAWLIPMSSKSVSDIPQAIVHCDTVNLGDRFISYLDSLIPPEMPDAGRAVLPYYSYQPEATQDQYRADFDEGRCRVLVATNCASVGVNVKTTLLVCLSLPPTIAMISQWTGRAGRGVGNSVAIIYAPDALRLETEIEINGSDGKDGKARKAKMSLKMLEERKRKRAGFEEVMILFLNPTQELCCRGILVCHFGDPIPPPNPHCCIVEEPDNTHAEENRRRAESKEKAKRARLTLPPSKDGSKPSALGATAKKVVKSQLEYWRLRQHVLATEHAHLPSSFILPGTMITRLIDYLHAIHNRTCFDLVVSEWSLKDIHGDDLYAMVERVRMDTLKLRPYTSAADPEPPTPIEASLACIDLSQNDVGANADLMVDHDSRTTENPKLIVEPTRRTSDRIQITMQSRGKRQAEEEDSIRKDSPKKRRIPKENATIPPAQPPISSRYIKQTRYGRIPMAKDRAS